jgi:osmotically-inducible protein OsmY
MRHPTILVLVAAVLTCAIAQAGDVYKYTDERGQTMYTDKPIPGAVRVSTGAQRPAEVTARSYAAQQSAQNSTLSASNQRIADQQNDSRIAATVAKDLETTRADRCKKARADYQTTINSRRLYRDQPGGKREYLSDAELAAMRVEAAKQVESICGPQG